MALVSTSRQHRSIITGRVLPVPRPPALETVVLCPVCRQKMQRTDEQCPSCNAERHFGPTRNETLLSTAIGLVATPALSLLIVHLSLWTLAFAIIGVLGGFFVAHSRHSGDRWLRLSR